MVRFPERTQHLIFETRGIEYHRVYPNGISTSLPEDVQDALIRRLKVENVVMSNTVTRLNTIMPIPQIGSRLQHSRTRLYFMGVNGTSGHEEAAIQGFIVGVCRLTRCFTWNAPKPIWACWSTIWLPEALGSLGRMFTSRAEHRL